LDSSAVQPQQPEAEMKRQPVVAVAQVDARDRLDSAKSLVEARPVDVQVARRALSVARVVKVALQRDEEIRARRAGRQRNQARVD
jgi:hypothetical protein